MKKFIMRSVAAICLGIFAVSCAACSGGANDGLLGVPAQAERIDADVLESEAFQSYLQGVNAFAGEVAADMYAQSEGAGNMAVSPISVYAALALAAQCAGGTTREQIVTALHCDYATLYENFGNLYRTLEAEYRSNDQLYGKLQLSDSIWLDQRMTPKRDCIDALSQNFYAYSYRADFARDNTAANKAVRAFVKDKTNGLIDRDFAFSGETLFALINTLYLNDVWCLQEEGLWLTDREYPFAQGDGTVRNTPLLQAEYEKGRAYQAERYTTFYAQTLNGYKLKIILPREGNTIDDVFTPQTLAEVNGLSEFGAVDVQQKVKYYTRCLFPEFNAQYHCDVAGVLKELGVTDLFDASRCDFSALTDRRAFCGKVAHAVDLRVDRKGIEGAAVTTIDNYTSTGPDMQYKYVYEDFVVDRAFAFILTDRNDVVLFSGAVNEIG